MSQQKGAVTDLDVCEGFQKGWCLGGTLKVEQESAQLSTLVKQIRCSTQNTACMCP